MYLNGEVGNKVISDRRFMFFETKYLTPSGFLPLPGGYAVYLYLSIICSNFFTETAVPIKAKFYVEPPLEEGTYIYRNGLDHMANIAAMPKYIKNRQNIFLQNQNYMILKPGMRQWGLKLYKVYINDDPRLTMTYLMARSNLVAHVFK